MDMGKSIVSVRMPWLVSVCLLLAFVFLGCGGCDREPVVSELHFELQPPTSPNACFPSDRAAGVREYFSREELHIELGETLGRTESDVGDSLSVEAYADSNDRFILRAEGKAGKEAGVLASAALARFENHLIELHQSIREESRAHLEKQIDLQKLKVAAAKSKMDAALENLESAQPEDR
jgi:hypothetical protein